MSKYKQGGTVAILLIKMQDAPTITSLKHEILVWLMRENIWMREKEEKDLGHGLQQTFIGYLHSIHPQKANRDNVKNKNHKAINNILNEDGA